MSYPLRVSLRADSARVRDQMLAAARRRIEAGDLDLPLNAVAKDAGVGVGTVYRHFPTRQELLEALAADSLAELAGAAERAAEAADAGAALGDFLAAALSRLDRDPALALVLGASDAACDDTLRRSRELLGSLTGLLDRARAGGAVRADVTAGDLRALVCGVHHAAEVAGTGETGRYLRILLDGLRP
jgi:AcrR family transcriptional regulator